MCQANPLRMETNGLDCSHEEDHSTAADPSSVHVTGTCTDMTEVSLVVASSDVSGLSFCSSGSSSQNLSIFDSKRKTHIPESGTAIDDGHVDLIETFHQGLETTDSNLSSSELLLSIKPSVPLANALSPLLAEANLPSGNTGESFSNISPSPSCILPRRSQLTNASCDHISSSLDFPEVLHPCKSLSYRVPTLPSNLSDQKVEALLHSFPECSPFGGTFSRVADHVDIDTASNPSLITLDDSMPRTTEHLFNEPSNEQEEPNWYSFLQVNEDGSHCSEAHSNVDLIESAQYQGHCMPDNVFTPFVMSDLRHESNELVYRQKELISACEQSEGYAHPQIAHDQNITNARNCHNMIQTPQRNWISNENHILEAVSRSISSNKRSSPDGIGPWPYPEVSAGQLPPRKTKRCPVSLSSLPMTAPHESMAYSHGIKTPAWNSEDESTVMPSLNDAKAALTWIPAPQKNKCAGYSQRQHQRLRSESRSSSRPSVCSDPQSIAARHRRERISERLKILQQLVPNGSKVDLVTMLEKAISYVKSLQLQIEILSTDEYWPTPLPNKLCLGNIATITGLAASTTS
ncbi:hypothetical protein KP509_01G013400 [Ceratopteris richardii]|uniref:BHLH domain-containing protein n=1 Tax=Ceratopteris richardii TaxID=49495 RepID=A0A8T2VI74_CERRI|nr:hypothetical protein KP509_01G013400 [Ceratopteris richardii]